MTIYIGLDLSLVSPGVAVYNTTSDTWALYGFAQRVREYGLTKNHHTTSIVLLPPIPNSTSTTNEERYEYIRHAIVDTILSPLRAETDVVIGIESYAFGAKNAGSAYKLQELGGVLKHSLWTHYPHWSQETVPPGKWKKLTTGNGRATKADVIAYVCTHGPCLPLLDLLGLAVTKNGDIPCPAQDLADASCLCLGMSHQKRRSDAILK
jgi:Holliday junction resolvasome RuvABC endonuclease subunit